jgi:short-subunit dehydrogenase
MFGITLTSTFVVVAVALIYSRYWKEYRVHSNGVILITGTSTGIGRHAVENLSKKYPNFTFFAGVRKIPDMESIQSLNISNLFPLIIDVSQHDSIVNAITFIKEYLKKENLPFVGLVNNAGISRMIALEFHPMLDLKEMFETNVFGGVDLIQQALPLLREGKGRIISISSISGTIGLPGLSIYSATKFALEGIHDSLRREVAKLGVSVSVIQPGFVSTTLFDKSIYAVSNLLSESDIKKMKQLYKFPPDPSKEFKSEPTVTTDAIDHALFSRFPQTRYVVAVVAGLPAFVVRWVAWLLNDRLLDLLDALT